MFFVHFYCFLCHINAIVVFNENDIICLTTYFCDFTFYFLYVHLWKGHKKTVVQGFDHMKKLSHFHFSILNISVVRILHFLVTFLSIIPVKSTNN